MKNLSAIGKILFPVLFLTVLGAARISAQVTIGSDAAPHPGAVLDLQSNGTRGLNMPHVSLTSATEWSPVNGNAVEGMIVFNTSQSTSYGLNGKGIYVWIGGFWNNISTSLPSSKASTCEGAFIFMGAYQGPGPGEYNSRWGGAWDVDWTGSDKFTPLNKDLCWAKEDIPWNMKWNETQTSVPVCSGDWRLPNLRELQELYKALGGKGSTATSFGSLKSPNSNSGDANKLNTLSYWSSTEVIPDNAYAFSFNNGNRIPSPKNNLAYVRCVREL